nr:MAG TPA: hypothetical protein [Caudoviricetes sp.]
MVSINIQKAVEEAQKENKNSIIKLRVSEEQKDRFMVMCKKHNVDASALIRAMMQQFIDSEIVH